MSEWVSVYDRLPVKPGELSNKRFWVQAQEFGQPPVFAVCKCWLSSEPNQNPQWYLDADFYGLDAPYKIAQEVQYWMDIPDPAPYIGLQVQLQMQFEMGAMI